MRLVITSTVKNAPASVARCIRSVRDQSHEDWQHIVCAVDAETCLSAVLAAEKDERVIVREHRECDRPHLANLLPLWRELPPKTPIVWLDGDDWLAVPHALSVVARAHEEGALSTYGTFLMPDGMRSTGFTDSIAHKEPRREPWRASHLKTFRAGLVQAMRDEDFREESGAYAGLVSDLRVMFGVLELAPLRARYIPNALVVYNADHSFHVNASREEREREWREEVRVRAFEPYLPLPATEQERLVRERLCRL